MCKQHFIKALECKNSPKEIPFWELEFHLWNKFSQKTVYLGEAFSKLSKKEKQRVLVTNADAMAEVCSSLSFSALTIPGDYWEIAPGKPAYYWLPKEERLEFAKMLVNTLGKDVALIANTGGVLCIPESDKYVEFAMALYEKPKEVLELAKTVLENSFLSIKKFQDIGINIFLTASDLADNSGPFFCPEHFHDYILPFLTQWTEFIKENNGYSILHSDGDISTYIKDIANTPLNGLQAIDPLAGMDILKLKNEVGNNLCLCGNVDVGLFFNGNPEQIYENTITLLKSMSNKPGFSLGASNVIEESSPKENFEAMVVAYRHFLKNC